MLIQMRRRSVQLALPIPAASGTRGGARRGAGRKRRTDLQSHVRRAEFDGGRFPLHVTVRFARHVWNLRSQRGFACVRQALSFEAQRGELRVVHYSVQGNHLHMVVEAADKQALSRRMQGFGIRLARRLNAMMGRRGRVYGDRYHARVLGSPRAVWHAIRYVLKNHAHHAVPGREVGARDRWASGTVEEVLAKPTRAPPPPWVERIAPGSGKEGPSREALTSEAETWLLAHGWRRGRGRTKIAPLR